jgi:hypothetical protein
MTDLGIDETIFRTCNQDETLDLHEICQFRGVDLPHADSITLLSRFGEKLADV